MAIKLRLTRVSICRRMAERSTTVMPGVLWILSGILLFAVSTSSGVPSDFAEAQKEFFSGNYGGCIGLAQKAIKERPEDEDWQILLSQALLTAGRYEEARTAITNALAQDSRNIR